MRLWANDGPPFLRVFRASNNTARLRFLSILSWRTDYPWRFITLKRAAMGCLCLALLLCVELQP